MIFSVSAIAGIDGEQFIDDWSGEYEVTNCLKCPDHAVDDGVNMKNFKWFSFGYHIPPEFPTCAVTDKSTGFSFNIESDDGNASSTVTTYIGMCYFGKRKKLKMTKDTLEYYLKGHNEEVQIKIEKIGDNKFKMYRKVEDEKPSWGYPKSFEYEVEAIMVN